MGGQASPEIKVGGLGPCGSPGSATYGHESRAMLMTGRILSHMQATEVGFL